VIHRVLYIIQIADVRLCRIGSADCRRAHESLPDISIPLLRPQVHPLFHGHVAIHPLYVSPLASPHLFNYFPNARSRPPDLRISHRQIPDVALQLARLQHHALAETRRVRAPLLFCVGKVRRALVSNHAQRRVFDVGTTHFVDYRADRLWAFG
jgi:hypothetical protein